MSEQPTSDQDYATARARIIGACEQIQREATQRRYKAVTAEIGDVRLLSDTQYHEARARLLRAHR